MSADGFVNYPENHGKAQREHSNGLLSKFPFRLFSLGLTLVRYDL